MQKVAFILIGIGILALIGVSVRFFFMAVEIPLYVRIPVGAVGVGALILIGLAIKDRMEQAKTDKFEEVDS